jgi:hypothetical protein
VRARWGEESDPVVSLSRFTTNTRRWKWLRRSPSARRNRRDFPKGIVWCKLVDATDRVSNKRRRTVPTGLTNRLHAMITHRVHIQTLRRPGTAGPDDPNAVPEVKVRNQSSIREVGTPGRSRPGTCCHADFSRFSSVVRGAAVLGSRQYALSCFRPCC